MAYIFLTENLKLENFFPVKNLIMIMFPYNSNVCYLKHNYQSLSELAN